MQASISGLSTLTTKCRKYPKKFFKTASSRMRKGFCLAELGQKAAAIRELRTVVRQYRHGRSKTLPPQNYEN